MSVRKRIRDLIIETLIAVILVTAYVVYLFMVPNSPWRKQVLSNGGVYSEDTGDSAGI